MSDLKRTPLYDLHVSLGAKIVPFAGYEMPVQYPAGVMKEHTHTRESAGLFDVSHMGQVILRGDGAAAALETLIPMDAIDLPEGRQRYGYLLNDQGGIMDDLMFANRGDHLFLVVNAGCKVGDIAHLKAHLPASITVTEVTDRALLALQGPAAEVVLAALNPAVENLTFMDVATIDLIGVPCWISRSGYTGEDGFEISVPATHATELAEKLLENDAVAPIGLGARDSLRLEAGLCLHGHDIDAETTPVQAALTWAIQEGRAPMREGVPLFATAESDAQIGMITSGGFGPTVGGPVAMGYVATAQSKPDTTIYGELRGKRLPLTVTKMPFTPANFKR